METKSTQDVKRYAKHLIGKVIVSKTGKRFGEVDNISFELRTGELMHIQLKNPTGYCEGLELERTNNGGLLIPWSSVIAIGDFVVIAEEDII
ncbi:MAG: PRC-barrel domain-containing protein [Nanoarchaeota archaeon]|nr:PRC-barrel domain-containing protein [Nanoarchaeota archaeon]MBU0962353.1 PRC-barrel domain-containing protein [Nanoarchaeota archaeon]